MKPYAEQTQLPLGTTEPWSALETISASLKSAIYGAIAVMITCLLLFSSPSKLQAQAPTGGMAGTVTDASGAVVPGATVEIKNSATGVISTGVTTSAGRYDFESVLPGNYSLTVTKPGFGVYSASGITVQIQQAPTVNVILKTGSVSETVTVSSAVPLMQAESSQINQTITGQQVNDLPLVARDWTTLGQLAAGVTTLPGDNSSDSRYIVNGQSFNQVDFRLNGIDDNVEMFPSPSAHRGTNAAILPPPDAIQEFTLESGGFSAESGHSLGAVINAAVKTGTNHIHGDLWEYARNDAFNANDYFTKQQGKKIPEYRQNQFGATIGGPVYIPKLYDGRNRTFFFFDWQSTRIITPGGGFATVPTPNMVSSNFTNLQDLITYNSGTQTDALGRVFPTGTVFDASTTRSLAPGAVDPSSGFSNTTASTIYVRDPFYSGGSVTGIKNFTGQSAQLNMLPSSRLDQNVVALLKLFPAATQPGVFSNDYFRNTRNPNNDDQFDIRGDEQINEKNSVFVVYSRDHSNLISPNVLAGVIKGGGISTDYPIWAIAGGYNHTFTPSLLNVLTVGFNHAYQDQGAAAGTSVNPTTFGITGVPTFPAIYGQTPNIGITGLSGIGTDPYQPTFHTLKALQLADNLSWNRGKHNANFGAEVFSIEGTALQPIYPLGNESFNGRYTSIPNGNTSYTGLSDALLTPTATTVPSSAGVTGISYNGGPSSYAGSNVSLMDYHRWYLAGYAQDDWHVMPHLTLNLGVRWDYFGPQADVNGKDANMEFYGGNGPGGTFYLPRQTCGFPRSPAFNAALAKDNIVVDCVGNNLNEAQHDNFSPRVGFADQITSKFVVRGGYGISFSSLEPRGTGQMIGQNYPFEYTVYSSNSNNGTTPNYFPGTTNPITFENAIASIGLQDPAQISGVGTSLFGAQYKFQTPYTQTANLAVQFAVTNNSTLTTQYVGELGKHLQVENAHNSPSQLVARAGAITANYIPAPDFAANSIYETTNGISAYHSFQTIYQLRTRNGDSLLANYTFAKCMQDANEFQYGVGYRAPWLPGVGIRGDYQLCSSDAKNVVHASGTYHLPFGHGKMFLATSNTVVNAVLGGWVVNAIYTYQSGQPFTVGCPTTDFAFFGCNANLVPGQDPYAGPHNVKQWLNRAAFTMPPTFAQVGANVAVLGETGPQVRGPSYITTSASLFKELPIHEAIKLQFRVEAFNLFNQVAFGNPGQLNFTNPKNFSQITSDRQISGTGARILQLALKLYY